LGESDNLDDPTETETVTIEITTIYEDIWAPWPQVHMVFVAQTTLICGLMYWSFVSYDGESSKNTYGFWVMAYLVQMSGLFKRGKDSALGPTWNLQRHMAIFKKLSTSNKVYFTPTADANPAAAGTSGLDGKPWWEQKICCNRFHKLPHGPQKAYWDVLFGRNVMGFLVNTLFRDLLAFLTPLLLMQSEDAKDFVQNCFAVAFITQLDDIGDGKDLYIILGNGDEHSSWGYAKCQEMGNTIREFCKRFQSVARRQPQSATPLLDTGTA